MNLYVSTTGTNVSIPELGITIVHPTTDRQLDEQFSPEQIRLASTLTAAIQAGTLTWKQSASGATQPAANYDADYLEIERERLGAGQSTVRPITPSASTIQLLASDANIMIFSGGVAGQLLNLPLATSVPLGQEYIIYNRSDFSISLRYQDGSSFFVIPAYSKTVVTAQDVSTANGDWFLVQSFNNIASGIVNYNVISSTPFVTTSAADVLITDFTITPIAGRYAVFYSGSNSHTTNNNQITSTIYGGGTAVADSARTVQTVSANFTFLSQSQTVTSVNGAQAVDVRVRRSTNGTLTVGNRSMILIRLGAE